MGRLDMGRIASLLGLAVKTVELDEGLRIALAGRSGSSIVSTPLKAVGIPAVLQSVGLIAETGMLMPIVVYSVGRDDVRERAVDSWQSGLLRKHPAVDYDPVSWLSDYYTSMIGFGNFFAEKVKSSTRSDRRVLALTPLDPRTVSGEWRNGRIVYTVTPEDGAAVEATRDDIFHVRGMTLHGEALGMSRITACRLALGSGMSLEQFLNSFYENDARPGGVLEVPAPLKRAQMLDILEQWNEQHRGATKRGRTAVLSGGMSWKQLGMSLIDAQFVEAHRVTVEQSARILNVPPPLLGIGESTREHFEQLVQLTVGPYAGRLDSALSSDRDLFPDDDGMYAETLADALLKPNTRERFEAYRAARQGGWITPNEIRRLENMGPVKGGDEIQQTPVGGAPNPGRTATDPPADPPAPGDDNGDDPS